MGVPEDEPMATMRPPRMTIVALSIGAPPLPSITRAPRRAVVWASASVDAPMTSVKDIPSEQNRLMPRIAKSSHLVSRRFGGQRSRFRPAARLKRGASLDHLVGTREQAVWHGETQRLRGLEVDH